MHERIAITGVELVCALGGQPHAVAARLIKGESGLAPATWVGDVQADLKQALGGKGWRHHQKAGLMACLTAKRLLRQEEEIIRGAQDPAAVGLVLGYDHDLFSNEFVETIRDKTLNRLNPAYFLTVSTNAVASQVSIYLGIQGFTLTVTTGFLAGLEAIDAAARAIHAGRADLVLAGGVEENTPEKISGYATAFQSAASGDGLLRMGEPNRIPAGEGCALLRLEKESHALEHQRTPLAYVQGFGMGFNPEAQGASDPRATCQAIETALRLSGIMPEDIDAVFLSANGYAAQEATELLALEKIFAGKVPPAVAVKSAVGETFHAGGALAAALAIACAGENALPPTQHLWSEAWATRANVSSTARIWKARQVLVLALEQDCKAGALVLSFK